MMKSNMFKLDFEKRRIFLSGDIDESLGLDFLESFLELEKSDGSIDIIFLSSSGGDWDVGVGLLSVICNSKNHINTYGIGPNCSTSAMLLLCGDSRFLAPRASLMLHTGTLSIESEWENVINYAEISKKELELDYEFLSERSNKPPSYWKEKLSKGDQYINSDLAIELGLIDGVKLPNE